MYKINALQIKKTQEKEKCVMDKKKKLGNKGFSLVELIIVIAIMVLLVGLLAPQYIKYLDKSRIAADTQLLDNVRQAMTTTLLDPDVTDGAPKGKVDPAEELGDPAKDYWKNVYDILGVADKTALIQKLKYDNTSADVNIMYSVDDNKNITLTITGGNYSKNNKVIIVPK